MSPKREIDETKGASPDEKVAEEAAEAKAEAAKEEAPKRRRGRKKAEEPAEPQAAEPAEEADEDAEAPAPTPKVQRSTAQAGPVAVRARARYVRTSARKARLVCDHIRGKSVPEARAILNFTPRAAARDWSKVLESAVANAEANHELIGDELKIAEAYADEGPTLKRYRPRAMGRATRIRKRTSHLTITLAPAAVAANGRKDR
jgi:ribosomal protein L22